jgi:hypothetical protein
MHDALEPLIAKQLGHRVTVGDIELEESEAWAVLQLGQAVFLEAHIVVGVEIVDADDLIATLKKRPAGMKTDETGGTRHQDFHADPCFAVAIRNKRFSEALRIPDIAPAFQGMHASERVVAIQALALAIPWLPRYAPKAAEPHKDHALNQSASRRYGAS